MKDAMADESMLDVRALSLSFEFRGLVTGHAFF